MPKSSSPAPNTEPTIAASSALAMAQAEVAGAASIGLVMFNAAQAEQGCQQIELTVVGVVCAAIVAAAVV